MTQENTKFQYFIGGLLRVVSNEVSQTFTRNIAEKGVSPGEWMVLRTLYQTKLKTPSEVADFIGSTRGAISKIVDKLSQKNFVIRTELASDRRFQEIKLTQEAKTIIPDLVSRAAENDEHFFSCLSKEERKTFRQLLEKIAESNDIRGIPAK